MCGTLSKKQKGMMKMETNVSVTSKNFAFGMMWGGKAFHALSVLSVEDVCLAVNKAYRDMIQHNVPGLGLQKLANYKCTGDKARQARKKEIFAEKQTLINAMKQRLAAAIVGTFQKGTLDHEALCESFIADFGEVIRRLNAALADFGLEGAAIDPASITYGLAQKIVNMTFKYAYLFDDSGNHKDVFKACHMPLDRYILGYLRTVGVWKVDAVREDDTWSKLSKEDYQRISGAIFAKCGEMEGDLRYPLFAEFYIWPLTLPADLETE